MTILRRSDVPACILNAAPEFKGREIKVEVAETCFISGTFWSEGCKNVFVAVELSTGAVSQADNGLDNPQEYGGIGSVTVPIPPGVVIVEWSRRANRESLRVYARPGDFAPKALPAGEGAMSLDEKIVLKYTSGLKSSYAGIKDYRFHSAHEEMGISRERWDAAKASCISKGWLNKAGAITTAGKNVK